MLLALLLGVTSAALQHPGSVPMAVSPSGAIGSGLHNDCAASEPGIRIDVSGLRDRSGRLKLELYPANADDFLADDDALLRAGKVFRRVVTAVPPDGMVSLCVAVPRPGRYAVLVIHKRDGSRAFSISNDGVGLPGSQHIGRHRPPIEQAIVTVPETLAIVTARMQYLRGIAGFKPMPFRPMPFRPMAQ
ncbi:DUF2141 domain-containing protein [Sphingomonas sp. CFBP 13728]|uniref:DUF2141 domain-containing protein n=1 Tax=Sphingomonas sp. CFBP 13728 TaxID=2775294 RepID=UPI0017875019|nr:DUF2141 domain-containing protein [Sphingomonas sp. CFBP 13728]MBD8617638.1 DUF2141 domain-containing protein [Sphingomonas sp. CFBP 13728]